MGDIDRLIKRLKSRDYTTKQSAARALAALRDPAATGPLIGLLGDGDRWVAWAVGQALARMGAPAVGPLTGALQSGNVTARRQAAKALLMIGDASAAEPLIRALGDRDMLVRWGAAEALDKIGLPAIPSLIGALGNDQRRVAWAVGQALARMGAPAVGPLTGALQSGNVTARRQAAKALLMIGDASAAEPLIRALGDDNEGVARYAAAALRRMDPVSTHREAIGRCMPIFARALEQGADRVQLYVISVLKRIGGPDAMGMLMKALEAKNENIRAVAADALGNMERQP